MVRGRDRVVCCDGCCVKVCLWGVLCACHCVSECGCVGGCDCVCSGSCDRACHVWSDPVVDGGFSVLMGDWVKGCACEKLSHLLNQHFCGAAIVPEGSEGGKSSRVYLVINFKYWNKCGLWRAMQSQQKCVKWDSQRVSRYGVTSKPSPLQPLALQLVCAEHGEPWTSHTLRQPGPLWLGPVTPGLWVRKPSVSKVVQFVLEPHPKFPPEVHKLGMGYLLVRKGEMLKHHQQKLDNV